ncbi:hypothetical protein SLA2020_336750, partial [Shorea laevis]
MGYLGFFYVEAKSFEFRSAIGDGSVRLAERSRGLFRAVHLSRMSFGWFVSSMEALRVEGDAKEFCRTVRVGTTVHILHRRGNKYGRFLELSEYGDGGRRSFVILPEGRKGSGWAKCLSQLRRVAKSFEKEQTDKTKLVEISRECPVQKRTVEKGESSYAAVLVGKGHCPELLEGSRGKLGSGASSLLPNEEALGRKVPPSLAENLAGKAGALIMPLQYLKGNFELETLRSMLRSFKEEAERLLGLLDSGSMGYGLFETNGPLPSGTGKDVDLVDAGENPCLGRSGAQGADSTETQGLAVYSRRSPVVQNLLPVPEMRVSVPEAPVINAGWAGKIQKSPITILKRGDSIPAGGEAVSVPMGQSRSAQSATMNELPGVSTEGSPCVVGLEEKLDSGPESADTASGSTEEILT